jgi:hypothetical protein
MGHSSLLVAFSRTNDQCPHILRTLSLYMACGWPRTSHHITSHHITRIPRSNEAAQHHLPAFRLNCGRCSRWVIMRTPPAYLL